MDMRKNIYDLPDNELENFKEALQRLKDSGIYDDYTQRHWEAMHDVTLIAGGAPFDQEGEDLWISRELPVGNPPVQIPAAAFLYAPPLRNAAHRGPAFLPWHRAFIREFELDLQQMMPDANPPVSLPYWDWATDTIDGTDADLWNTDETQGRIYIGGDGEGSDDLATGPFEDWVATISSSQFGTFEKRTDLVGLIRMLGRHPDVPTLPDETAVENVILDNTNYAQWPWIDGASDNHFRFALEQVHNIVHGWVGGDMGPGTSPNDPVFYLHHCNVDRIWATWQKHRRQPDLPEYLPEERGPWGHNLNDTMRHLKRNDWTPASVLNYDDLQGQLGGYEYDKLVPLPVP